MRSISPKSGPERWIRIQVVLYRVGAYLLINFIDDPAWLALMFC